MALVQNIKRIDPLNLNKNVKIGVAFPLDENNLFTGTDTIEEQIKANLINLLLTVPGERINLPNYGVGLKNLLFEQQIDLVTLKEQIIDTTRRYIPNIKIQNVQTGMSNDENSVFIKISYKSILDGNSDSIQLNFN
tara:strand:- start:15071 stop:15478 length:408 start_codon:yes stop_codon:yes gene_type:complete